MEEKCHILMRKQILRGQLWFYGDVFLVEGTESREKVSFFVIRQRIIVSHLIVVALKSVTSQKHAALTCWCLRGYKIVQSPLPN